MHYRGACAVVGEGVGRQACDGREHSGASIRSIFSCGKKEKRSDGGPDKRHGGT